MLHALPGSISLASLLSLFVGCGGSATSPTTRAEPGGSIATVPAATPRPGLGFFVARSKDGSANFGGLAGADALCREAAAAVGAGDRSWRAYLSAAPANGQPAVDARDRIGPGPWFNAKGALIARSVDDLHADRHHIDVRTALDAAGGRAERQAHDLVTGTQADGRLAFVRGAPATCANWASAGDGVTMAGHDDRMDHRSFDNKRFARWNGSWNADHATLGCSAKQLAGSGGAGGFYCFAADPRPEEIAAARPPAPDPAQYTFLRGVNLNHWLASNVAPDLIYGASWFDAEDVGWIADHGFDHLRIWVNGAEWLDARGHIDEAKIAPFDAVLRWARDRRLGVVLAMRGLPGYRQEVQGSPWSLGDEANRADGAYVWWQIAQRYVDIGAQLRFELLVGPNAPNADELRAFHAAALDEIRRVDRARVVYLTPRGGSIEHVDDVLFPDPNTALSLGFIEPEILTYHLGDPRQLKVTFPGKVPALRALPAGAVLDPAWVAKYSNTEWNDVTLAKAVEALAEAAAKRAGRHEVYVSRIGVMSGADDASAKAYMHALRGALEANGLGWAVFDYHTGGAIRADGGTLGPTRIIEGLGLGR